MHRVFITHKTIHRFERPAAIFAGRISELVVLTWIERLADKIDLTRVLNTARDLKAYLQRREEQRSPLGRQYKQVSLWVVDLTRIVMAFGNHLAGMPFAIHFLIPPICPSQSKIFTQFASDTKSLEVVGASAKEWHDRLSCITHRDVLCTAIACLDNRLVVGLGTGTVVVYEASNCREIRRLEHGERVQCLKLASINPFLAVAGRKSVSFWNCVTGDRLWSVSTPSIPLTLWYNVEEDHLFIAMKSNNLSSCSIRDGMWNETRPWHDRAKHQMAALGQKELQKTPTIAECSMELNLLAIAYRNKPLMLWDLEECSFIGSFDRRASPRSEQSMTKTMSEIDSWVPSSMASALAFNPDPWTRLLAIAYQDGDLCVIDPIYQELRAPTVVADASVLAASPDGKTLATGDAAGTIKLFNFETLELYYSISCVGYDVKAICFGTDSLRVFDIRGPQCNVWEPAVLLRRSDENTEDSLDDAPLGPAQIVEAHSWDESKLISALLVDHTGDYIFCAKEDGSVWAYDVKNGSAIEELYHHAEHIAVHLLTWNAKKSLLGSADLSGRFTVRKIHIRRTGKWQIDRPLIDERSESTINQLLLNPAGDRLLCSASIQDYLWDMNERQVAAYQPLDRELRKWIAHPVESKLILMQSGANVRSFLWSSLQELKTSRLMNYTDIVLDGFTFHSGRVIDGSNCLVLEHIKHDQTAATRRITLWNLQGLHNQNAELPVHASYLNVAKEISSVVEMYGSSLIFLNHLHWFCTLDLSDPDDATYIQHFFVPPEWNSSSQQPICGVTVKGDVVVVKDDGIVVAKNGLSLDNIVRLKLK